MRILVLASLAAMLAFGQMTRVSAQSASDVAKILAPGGSLHVGMHMVPYLAIEDVAAKKLTGLAPGLSAEFAKRMGVTPEIYRVQRIADLVTLFVDGNIEVTFVAVTPEITSLLAFSPPLAHLHSSYLVPASSTIKAIGDVDRPGVRILVPERSAQEAYLKEKITKATVVTLVDPNPRVALDLIAAGKADAYSNVVPMLTGAQRGLAGSRILAGSYFDNPVAVGFLRGRQALLSEFMKKFVADMKSSGFVAQEVKRMGAHAQGLVVAAQ